MSDSLVALLVISFIVGLGAFIGFYACRRHEMDLEQWTVGGRGFGVVLVWLLMAGEVYTTFTFLGASGWAYSKGGPVLYILGYQPLIYVASFYILPQMWQVAQKHKLQTQADFFRARYASKSLEALVALMGVIFILPYLQLQLTGLGIIMEVASFGRIPRTPAMIISFTIVAAFVFTSGIRGVAWVSGLKDILLLFAALFIGIAIPYHYFGGVGPLFTALIQANPRHLVMPGATPNLGHSWYITTVLLTALGFFMWPQFIGGSFTAKSGDTLLRNAVVMPLYSITMPLMLFVGFTAALILPGLSNGDLSLLTMVQKTFPAWFLGVIGGAGALTAMVPAAVLILTAATLFIKNFVRPVIAPHITDSQVARLAKITVVAITAVALVFAILSSTSLVSLLLLGYAGVAQFFPGVVFGLYWKRVSAVPVLLGLSTGVAIAASLSLTHRDPFLGWNAGFIGLCANFAVTVLASFLVRREPSDFVELAFASPHKS